MFFIYRRNGGFFGIQDVVEDGKNQHNFRFKIPSFFINDTAEKQGIFMNVYKYLYMQFFT